jgi:hypothetical protein
VRHKIVGQRKNSKNIFERAFCIAIRFVLNLGFVSKNKKITLGGGGGVRGENVFS